MSFPDVIDLSSDEEIEEALANDVKPLLSANSLSKCEEYAIKQEVEERRSSNSCSCISEQGSSSANGFASPPGSPGSPVPLCRQFWKSGDYEPRQAFAQVSQSGTDRLRIHPKFLHSNATSHKWAFGAIAELLDNAVDELQNGATFVVIDKFINPRNGNPALLIRDDGGGMDPESLRRCMSFGFSDKHSDSSIGQYGNGFKTSTMRLGADVIVFSRCTKKRWAHIASHLPGRTDNEIKNYWNSWIKKKIQKPTTLPSISPQNTELVQPRFNTAVDQLDAIINQNLSTKPAPENIFHTHCPIFMFDTSSTGDSRPGSSAKDELDATTLNSSLWNPSQHQDQVLPPLLNFSCSMDSTYLPPLVDVMGNTVPMEAQPCCVGDDGDPSRECFEKQELNEWVDSQQYSSLLIWDQMQGSLGGESLLTAPTNMDSIVTSFPSSSL